MSRGVLLLAHGTPDTLEDMPEYLRLVRDGREPSPALVEEMRHNYAAIGGRSPLTDITRAQAAALAREVGQPVFVGMRNWRPFIAEALREAQAAGVTDLLAVPMAPQYSTLSVEKYGRAVEAGRPEGVRIRFIRSWHDHPGLQEAFAARVREARARRDWEAVVFTAHSLPVRVAEEGDPYPEHVEDTAAGVARRAAVSGYRIAYQSAGRTPEPWLGPELEAVLEDLARQGARSALVVPIGFVCDHTEILFDLDVKARSFASERGLEMGRTESLNTAPAFIRALGDLVRAS
ncbi:MAG TPA: ferrochelatase [Vicinamibacteria bacterium]|jgi:ferrochelatase